MSRFGKPWSAGSSSVIENVECDRGETGEPRRLLDDNSSLAASVDARSRALDVSKSFRLAKFSEEAWCGAGDICPGGGGVVNDIEIPAFLDAGVAPCIDIIVFSRDRAT
mmetsp:Transcript_25678/g.50021  ORF Transcript_25678/g.50021 Transcript_25678/m.50021 type:complete len:109 (-) Transcript_25678:694-1020(-)